MLAIACLQRPRGSGGDGHGSSWEGVEVGQNLTCPEPRIFPRTQSEVQWRKDATLVIRDSGPVGRVFPSIARIAFADGEAGKAHLG